MVERIIVIGCGAAGATAAMQARKFNRKTEIAIINEEPYSQYSRCGLPYTISGKVREFNDLILMPPENWASLKIDAKFSTRVTRIDHSSRTVEYEGPDGSGTASYDSLVFATGARNADPPIEGLDKQRVYGLRSMDDAKALAKEAERAKNMVIIGGGLIGMEAAEAFHERGLNVTVVEFLPHVLLAMVDPDMAQIVEEQVRQHGVRLMTNTAAEAVLGEDAPKAVRVKNRETGDVEEIPADAVIVATGVRPVTELAESIGVEIGPTRGIKVDDHMRTNLDGVYACGDCAEHVEFVTRRPFAGGLGTVAVRQGRVAGINAAGGDAKFPGIVGAKVTRLFGVEIASTGLTEDLARRFEVTVVKGSVKGLTRPPYYQGGKEIKVKTIYEKSTGRLVGGQIVGPEDAAMRINVITLGIQQHVDAPGLFDFENCYAPAICDTWDPLVTSAEAARRRLRM
ncbi:MAG: FAD-dependent oxidoreductase [Candidatus Thorarchaeota archaeon]|nr:MAG: NADH oxidase [Candidatus Thorarchaeota archaeon]